MRVPVGRSPRGNLVVAEARRPSPSGEAFSWTAAAAALRPIQCAAKVAVTNPAHLRTSSASAPIRARAPSSGEVSRVRQRDEPIAPDPGGRESCAEASDRHAPRHLPRDHPRDAVIQLAQLGAAVDAAPQIERVRRSERTVRAERLVQRRADERAEGVGALVRRETPHVPRATRKSRRSVLCFSRVSPTFPENCTRCPRNSTSCAGRDSGQSTESLAAALNREIPSLLRVDAEAEATDNQVDRLRRLARHVGARMGEDEVVAEAGVEAPVDALERRVEVREVEVSGITGGWAAPPGCPPAACTARRRRRAPPDGGRSHAPSRGRLRHAVLRRPPAR